MKWFEPDERWEIYGVKSKEAFMESLVVTGKFHDKVPNDVVEAFETVSYLLAHSYYHWPLQDEALSKALLVMEMAVKLKAKELDIYLLTNKKQNKRLVDLIDEVCQTANLQFLKPDFERVRHLRNSKMHPDKHSFVGALGRTKENMMLFNNIINLLFLEKKDIEILLEKRHGLDGAFKPFENGNFVLEYNNTRILIDIVHYHKYIKFKDRDLLMLLVNPVLNNASETLSNLRFPNPLVITLKEFKINGITFEGKDINGGEIKIETTYKEENILRFLEYNEELKKVSQNDIDKYHTFTSQNALWEMERLVYENLWE